MPAGHAAGLAGGWRIVYFRGVTERWRDVAHIGHAELLTPTPEASLEYFTALLGLTVVAEQGESWYLRGYGDYESYCLKLTASPSPGLGHMAVRAWSPEALARRVSWLTLGVPEESVTSDWPAPALRKFSVRRVQRHRVARN
jgi:hypothetical protein